MLINERGRRQWNNKSLDDVTDFREKLFSTHLMSMTMLNVASYVSRLTKITLSKRIKRSSIFAQEIYNNPN